MSIELAIAENTAALNALAAAVRALVDSGYAKNVETSVLLKTVGATGGNVSEDQAAAAPKAEQTKVKKQSDPAATQEQKAENAAAADKVEETTTAPEPVTYDQCAAAITSLAKGKGRAAAVEVLKSFGAEKLPDVKEDAEKLAAIYVAATAALGA